MSTRLRLGSHLHSSSSVSEISLAFFSYFPASILPACCWLLLLLVKLHAEARPDLERDVVEEKQRVLRTDDLVLGTADAARTAEEPTQPLRRNPLLPNNKYKYKK